MVLSYDTFDIDNTKNFLSSIKSLTESVNNEYTMMKSYYCNDKQEVVTESFGSFMLEVIAVVRRFLKFLDRLVLRFTDLLSKAIKDDKYIVQSKDIINDYNPGTDGVKIARYIYTFLDDSDIPLADAAVSKSDYFMTTLKFYNMNRTLDSIKNIEVEKIKKMNEEFENETYEFLNNFRGNVLGFENKSIPENIFVSYCNRRFRNADISDPKKINDVIPYDDMQNIFRRFSSYDDIKNSITKTRDKINDTYNNMIDMFRKKATEAKYFDNVGRYQDEFEHQIRIYYQSKTDRVIQMCNIHLIAFSAKLKAVEEAYMSDKIILLACIKNVNKR